MSCLVKPSEAFTIGMHAVALLAKNWNKLLRVKKIAQSCGVSEAHLAVVLQRLARAGIVKSERGPAGGFALSCLPEEITMYRIWEIIDGPSEQGICPFSIPACRQESCTLGKKFAQMNQQLIGMMQETTLRDLSSAVSCEMGAGL
ncbi:Rrf2 family transcriptional regulator [Chitinispirillum alkaliphilum]|nr:Rrf2 family transcriptional regulator [Chitinispirillum alkaliphilum]